MLNDDGILGRVQIADFLKLSPLVTGVEYVTDYAISHAMLTDTIRHHVVIVEAQTAGFSGLEYRNILLRARFFLALPGIASIFTHSLVEALSCGLVPIMQKSTRLPAVFVDGRNCLLFSDLNHLCEVIRKAHTIDNRLWNELSANALTVYRDVFSPEAIGRDIWQALQQGKTLKIIQA
jgi:glycosyltransferase involved in cell wall biosynthesis